MMNDPMNKIIMNEIGLTVDSQSKVLDQDSREYLRYKSKNMKYSSQSQVTLGNKDIPFDPVSNKNIMSSLFDHFGRKIEDEGIYVSMYSERNTDDQKSSLEAKVNIDGEDTVLTTKSYYNDSLKYVDMIMQLNSPSSEVDLSKYDKKEEKEQDNKTTRGRKKKGIF